MSMGVDGKYMTTFLDILDLPGGKSNIGRNITKVGDDKIEPIIQEMDSKPINRNVEDEVLLKLEHNIYMWDKLT